jgi:hypothetical protein
MIRKLIYSIITAILLTSQLTSADTVITENFPNPGDTTTVETITTGNPVTTGNLLSQKWNDGSWEGTMFPDSSDINESIYLTGKDGKYAESTINSQDILTEQELQQGLTSNLSAQIRWWNPQESTVTMTQTATNGIDTTTQSIIFEDTTNHNYQFNTYQNNLTIAPNAENTHGTLTARFSFDIQGNANYNGGHSGVDVIQPELKLNYQALSSTTVTTVEYCWEKIPTTCPAQEEIADVETFLDTFEDDLYLDDIYQYEEEYFIPETIDFEYSFNDEYFEEEFEIENNYLTFDEFFFEDDYYQDDYYEEFELEEFYPEDMAFEEVEYFDELPEITFKDEYFEEFNMAELPPMEEMYFEEEMYFDEEMYIEAFTDEAFIEEFDEMFEDMPMEEFDVEMAEEMFEEVFEEYFEEEPPMEIVEEIIEEPIEEDIIEEEPMDESPMETVASVDNEPQTEKPDEVEEQPSSESPIADEPEETTDVAEQEEADEKPTELAVAEGSPTKEPDPVSEDVQGEPELETELDVKLAAIENVIKSQIKNTVQRTTATLNVINEIVSREMVAQQPDMSSYFNMNAALFDTRQIPSGNPAFFNQISLDTYGYTIYNEQVAMVTNMVGQDPVVQHEKKMRDINSRKTKVLIELKEMLNARYNQ